ncbi:hypothetical protein B7463_g12301, partial [Scytalidium lignicola]
MHAKILTCLAALASAAFAAPAPEPALGSIPAVPIPGIQWTVTHLTRNLSTKYLYPLVFDAGTKTNDYYITIHASNTSPQDIDCTITIPVDQPSWYAVPCDGEWAISWGYNQGADSAVMTVLNHQLQQDAWFGYDHVSAIVNQGPVGPNPVYSIGSVSTTSDESEEQ